MTGLPSFVIFGPAHIGALAMIAVLSVSIPLAKRLDKAYQYQLALIIALVLIGLEFSKSVIGIYVYGNPPGVSLPLHLCGIAALLTAWVLWRKSYAAYEIAYFWGVAGSIPTLFSPDVAAGFPHLAFFIFFSSHGMVVVGALYATFVYGYRPRLQSIFKTFLATMVLVIMVTPLNLLLDANYMFLRVKPERVTLMDYLGPWPWYIPALVMIGLGLCLIVYLPFAIADSLRSSEEVQ